MAQSELKDAAVQSKEVEEFPAAEGELVTLSALTRDIVIASKNMIVNPAEFMHTSFIVGQVRALRSIVDASSLRVAGKQKLIAFVQAQQADDQTPEVSPDNTGILDTLEETKAEEQLDTLRKEESKSRQKYALLKGSLEEENAYNTKNMNEEKAIKSGTEEAEATAADLVATTMALKAPEEDFACTQAECRKLAKDHDVSAGRPQRGVENHRYGQEGAD